MSLNPAITDWRGKRIWLVGASSGIGRATASALHARGAQVIVSARNRVALDDFVREHPGAQALPLDTEVDSDIRSAAESVLASGTLDGVVYCAGYYREQRATAFDLQDALKHLRVNYIGWLQLLDVLIPHFLAHKGGMISMVSSVAGFRGLPKSLAYGPTKAALINLAETLYLDLHASGIVVNVINPGFVETGLTAQNEFTMPALITPQVAAVAILKGWARGAFDIHFPKRFTLVMKLLRILPYRLYFPAVRKVTGL